MSDEDLDMLDEYGGAISFLSRLDEKGISKCVHPRSPLGVTNAVVS